MSMVCFLFVFIITPATDIYVGESLKYHCLKPCFKLNANCCLLWLLRDNGSRIRFSLYSSMLNPIKILCEINSF